MEIGTAEISRIIKEQIRDYEKTVEIQEIGTVLSTGDGIARIHGLDKVAAGELLEFPYNIFGIALNLEEDNVGAALFADLTDDEFLKECAISIEILNQSLRNVPAEQCRLHLCWGNYEGPHIHDIALEKLLPVVFKAKPQVISFEGANPRHGHEWEIWRRVKLPDDRAIMPGVLDSLTNYVEHPELVAQRIERFARAVGRENVIAANDCGFGTSAVGDQLHPDVAWAKLEALVEGARIASKRLWR